MTAKRQIGFIASSSAPALVSRRPVATINSEEEQWVKVWISCRKCGRGIDTFEELDAIKQDPCAHGWCGWEPICNCEVCLSARKAKQKEPFCECAKCIKARAYRDR